MTKQMAHRPPRRIDGRLVAAVRIEPGAMCACDRAGEVLATNSVMSDYLSVYARLATLRRVRDTFEADFELAEFGQ
jgi:hypothetical protein